MYVVTSASSKGFVATAYFTRKLKKGSRSVDKVRVYYDRTGNTLAVWFDDPKKEVTCEETNDDVILIKDRRGQIIGFERLNYLSGKQRSAGAAVPVEAKMMWGWE